ncbi:helix-turn-helix domain-containing protein [Mycobacteroides abscessus]|uniref:helix-turn-helix domain-containing protein n=1 Tax=Mycobacteroides abscessus TaxID=36809 RepID=UPI002103300E|nr:helix-turn-helix transcriptional regulator [Mycobacteroides abscessus]
MTQSDASVHDWKNPPSDWAEEQARRTALEIRRLRGKRSAQWLADRTEELGYAVSRSVISDLEVGRRRYVTTSELLIIARALNVFPIALMYPAPYDEPIEALPNSANKMVKILAVQWFLGGMRPEDVKSLFGGDVDEIKQNATRLDLAYRLYHLEGELRDGQAILSEGILKPGSSEEGFIRSQLSELQSQIARLRSEIAELNGR